MKLCRLSSVGKLVSLWRRSFYYTRVLFRSLIALELLIYPFTEHDAWTNNRRMIKCIRAILVRKVMFFSTALTYSDFLPSFLTPGCSPCHLS